MSSSCGSLCLLVLLGVVLASGLPCHLSVRNLNQTPDSIADVLNLKQPEIGANPLFSSIIKSINTSCQRKVLLMNATLDVYTRIFSSILQHDKTRVHLLDELSEQQTSKVKTVVKKLQQDMEKLRAHLSHPSHEKEDLFSQLNMIKIDDPVVQRKALAQFKEVYQAASVVVSPQCGHAHSAPAEGR
ncbi:interferon gamma 1-like [Plectropomus leopardus]|uniref:interferon gamma 1-like n=1 Tax=Plectropomus leopardus TaxID=160734 RepID=UPI001C4D7D6B|nr:interferon gamma 1-like [Plectropomus leopardus]